MNNSSYFPFERNRYFYGKMLTARDLETEQRYFNNKRRLINRTIIGVGVVCGLGVYQNDDTSFSVETGFALDYLGREIVVPAPIIRSIQMIDGVEELSRSEQAYLCLKYQQNDREPVNSIGAADNQSEQYNKIDESYRIYLSTEFPDVSQIYGNSGMYTVTALYSGHGLSIIRIVPRLVLSGEEFSVRFIVIKGIDSRPVSFTYSFDSEYFTDGNMQKSINMTFIEDPKENRDVFVADYTVYAGSVSETAVPLSSGKETLCVQMGDFSDKSDLSDNTEIYLCESSESYSVMRDTRMSSLENHIGGENTPIYLAKIDCMNIGTGYIIRHITPLPFGQRISFGRNDASCVTQNITAGDINLPQVSENLLSGGVSARIEELEYWQRPQVSASYDSGGKKLNFRFGMPSSQANDYTASSGVTDIPISGAIRVNARFVSEEIPHNLGIGDVSISVAAEYNENSERRLLFGNGDVFSSKNDNRSVPKLETAVILYPDKGTFKIGIKMNDYVEGHSVRVRWFAYKPTRDTAVMRSKENIVVKITPDIRKIEPLGRIHFTAEVTGTADNGVIWSVGDPDGGNIDENGLYQSPSTPGTYEIIATSTSDSESRTSAFVIVE